MEEIRSEHVASKTPAITVPGIEHRLRAQSDIIRRFHLKARVVKTASRILHQRQHMMVTARRKVQESDDAGNAIGQLQSEHADIEIRRALKIRREQQHMSQPCWPNRVARRAAPVKTPVVTRLVDRKIFAGLSPRSWCLVPYIHQIAVRIGQPQA